MKKHSVYTFNDENRAFFKKSKTLFTDMIKTNILQKQKTVFIRQCPQKVSE